MAIKMPFYVPGTELGNKDIKESKVYIVFVLEEFLALEVEKPQL